MHFCLVNSELNYCPKEEHIQLCHLSDLWVAVLACGTYSGRLKYVEYF